MGEVYLAEDSRLGRKVAVKILPAGVKADEEARRRFSQEARAASALNHPHIITIYDIGTEDGRDYIAMEYVEGESLRELLTHERSHLNRTLDLIAQAASGLAAAHQAGILHRDIKPENLIITRNAQVKILDFGLAKLSGKKVPSSLASDLTTMSTPARAYTGTEPGTLLGTIAYMSPEQAAGRAVDNRSDIFSLGVVLYEMLTGQRPFQGNSAVDVMHAIIYTEARHALDLNPELPVEVTDIVDKALAKNENERYQHAGDFGLDLRRLKRASESNTLRSARTETVAKETQTHKGLKWIAVGFVLILVSMIVGLWLGQTYVTPTGVSLENVSLTPFTTDPGYEGEPTFSPNSETIAYVSDRTGDFEIFIQQVSGGTFRNITENKADDVQPCYSPDGQQIAFVSSRSSSSSLLYEGYDLPLMGGDIWVMSALGGNAKRIAERGNFPSWSRDGSAIIYTAGPAFEQKVYRVGAQGGESREIVPKITPTPRFLLYPSYSADEQWIVLEGPAGLGGFGQRDIWVIKTATGDAQFIASGQRPSWSADSRSIIYSSAERGKNFSLWQVPFSTTEGKVSGPARPITVSRGRDAQATMSRDGRQIAFSAIEISFNVETLELDAETGRVSGVPEEVTTGKRVSYFQSFSPDGKSIVFEARHGAGSYLWKTSRGSVPFQLTADPNFDDTYPRWSPAPGANTIAFNRKSIKDPQSINGVWLMSDDGVNPRMLLQRAANFAWMPNGRGLIYFSPDDNQLHLFDLATSGDRRLTDEPKIIQILATSTDGKWLIYQTRKSGNIDLRAIPVEGGEERTVVETPHQDYHPFVSPSGKWLYFHLDHKNIFRVPGPAQGWRQAEPEKITTFPESGLFLEDPQISSDGKRLLYSRGRLTGDIWIIKLGE